MKKTGILLLVIMFMACACAKSGTQENDRDSSRQTNEQTREQTVKEPETSEGEPVEQNGTKKILVAYFSWADNALPDELEAMTSPSVTVPGNVAQLAAWVAEETGGDLFSIQVKEPYPPDWDGCLERANKEKGDNARPALKAKVENLEDYDTDYLGYPKMEYSISLCI